MSTTSELASRYIVDTTKRLAEFDTVGGQAFMVTDKENPSLPLYAFVQNPKIPVRYEVMEALQKKKISGLVCPVDYGVMALKLASLSERFVIIFERPQGQSLFIRMRVNKRLNISHLRSTLPLAFASTLAALHKENIIHRHIRPSNLFFVSADRSDDIMIGECVTAPPGYGTPLDLEPMELMFADPHSRGDGSELADMYQMGATLLTYYKNRPIWENRVRDQILTSRTQIGSFQSLVVGSEQSGSIATLVKGLMDDDKINRWDIKDVLNWFEGSAKKRQHSKVIWNLNKSTLFNGHSYSDRRTLADAFANEPKKAIQFVENLDFAAWIAEAIRSEVMEERVEQLLSVQTSERVISSLTKKDYQIVSRVCAHLHPGGPIRYKDISFMSDAVPSTISAFFNAGADEQIIALKEILNDRSLSTLAEIVGERDMVFFNNLGSLKRVTGTVHSVALGRGLERILYNSYRELPCQSIKLMGKYVDDAGKLASALNSSSFQNTIRAVIFDRHIAAYLASRNEQYATIINNISITERDPSRFAVLALDFFSRIQNDHGLDNMTHLLSMLIEGLRPSVSQLKNKKRKEKVKAHLEKMKQDGDIMKLVSSIDLAKIMTIDKRDFARARATFFRLDRHRNQYSHKYTAKDFQSKVTGYKFIRILAFLVFIIFSVITVV